MTNRELDDAVYEVIATHRADTFAGIRAVLKERWRGRDLYRPVDRSLQRLRKAGRIRCVGPRWSAVKS